MDIAPKTRTATIIEKRNLTGHIWLIRFRCDDPSFTFIPGQYGTIIIDETTRRQYSFASSPTMLPEGEFVVDTSPMGKGSLFIINSVVGETFRFLAPLGKFQFNETPAKKVFVATGTGIAPFRSMLLNEMKSTNYKSQIANTTATQEPRTKNQVPNFQSYTLYWGLRYEDDIYWDEEFKGIVGQLTGFQYFLCLSKPGENWKGLRGHVTEQVLQNEKDVKHEEFYLCGNKAMVEELSLALKNRGAGENNVKTDIFF